MMNKAVNWLIPETESRRWVLMIGGAVAWALSYAPFNWSFLSIFILLPIFNLLDVKESGFRIWVRYYLYMLIVHVLCLYWISFSTVAGGILAILANPVFGSVPVIVFLLTRKRLPASWQLVYFGLLWIGFEYLTSLWELAFPWMLLGHSLFLFDWILEWASVGGVWLLSAFVITGNLLVYHSLQSFRKTGSISKQLQGFAVGFLVVILIGGLILRYQPVSFTGEVKAAIVQPNVDPWIKWEDDNEYKNFVQLQTLTANALQADSTISLFVWPETSVSFYLLADRGLWALNDMQALAQRYNTSLATGFPHVVYFEDSTKAPPSARYSRGYEKYYQHFNAATVVDGIRPPQAYGKINLVPFAERVPWVDSIPFMKDLRFNLSGLGGWGKGADTTVFTLKNHPDVRFPMAICYESAFPHLIREFVRKGSTVLAVITNDGWWGNTSGYHQHFEFSRLRAIENRRWIIRSANNGISGFIDPHGNVFDKTTYWTEDVRIRSVGLSEDTSLFNRFGHWVPLTSLFAALFLWIFFAIRSRFSS